MVGGKRYRDLSTINFNGRHPKIIRVGKQRRPVVKQPRLLPLWTNELWQATDIKHLRIIPPHLILGHGHNDHVTYSFSALGVTDLLKPSRRAARPHDGP